MSNLLESLEWADGQINPSGIGTTVYYALKSEIKTMARIVRTPAPATAGGAVKKWERAPDGTLRPAQ